MAVAGRGRILVWEGASLWVLEGAGEHAGTDYHAHHAIQITLSLIGRFELRAGGECEAGPAVAVAPDTSHIFSAEGRAAFLFVERTGLPFRTWVLWLRIQRAVELYAAGASLTVAAHEAGFADSAHLSRTFRRTFGLPATALRVNSRFVQAENPLTA